MFACLLKKKAFSSDEWLFFFRKVIATFSATEMMTKFALSLAVKIQTLFYQHIMEYKPKYEKISGGKLKGLTLNRNILKILVFSYVCFL